MSTSLVPMNGPAEELTPSSSSAISLDSPAALLEFLSKQNDRIAAIEEKFQLLENGMHAAGRFFYDDPKGKMLMMAFPKEVQAKIKEIFGNGNRAAKA